MAKTTDRFVLQGYDGELSRDKGRYRLTLRKGGRVVFEAAGTRDECVDEVAWWLVKERVKVKRC